MATSALLIVFYSCLFISESLALDGESASCSNTKTEALEIMLAEEKLLRMKLESKVNDLVCRMNSMETLEERCSCNNTTTVKSSPAFMALLTNSIDQCNSKRTIVFDAIKVNSGSAYSGTNGVFTAPVSGVYAFYVTVTVAPQSRFHIAIVKNDTAYLTGLYLFDDGTGVYRIRSNSAVVHLNRGDKVWMICLSDSHIVGSLGSAQPQYDFHSHFSGFLTSKD